MVDAEQAEYLEAARELRQSWLDNEPLALLIREPYRTDFLDGKCSIRFYEMTPIMDYTKPWGTKGIDYVV